MIVYLQSNITIMLVIRAIKLVISRSGRSRAPYQVRIGYQSSCCLSKTRPRVLEGKVLEWREDMTLPIFFSKDLQLEFHPNHEFGYHPEQLDSVCFASFRINDYEQQSLSGEVKDAKGVKVGKFQVQYKVHNSTKSSSATGSGALPTAEVRISSLLAHLNEPPPVSGFFQLQVGDKKVLTPLITVIAGEMLWVDKMRIPFIMQKDEENNLLNNLRFSVVVQGQQIAESFIPLSRDDNNQKRKLKIQGSNQKIKRISIYRLESEEECGSLFIEFTFKEKKIQNTQASVQKSRSQNKLPMIHSDRTKRDHSTADLKSRQKTHEPPSWKKDSNRAKNSRSVGQRLLLFKMGGDEGFKR